MSQEVYIYGQMAVKDYQAYFTQYGIPFWDVLEQYQGQLLAATKPAKTLEGEAFGNWTVLIKFPNRDLAYSLIKSDEYAPLMKLRTEELSTGGRAILFPAEIEALKP